MRLPLAAVILLVASTPAAAQTLAVDQHDEGAEEADDDPFHAGRSEITLGMLAGSYRVGPVGGPAIGLHVDGGWNMRRFLVYGEYDFVSIGENEEFAPHPIRGLLHRFGAMGRYAVGEIGGGDAVPLQGQLWVEGGAGRQIVTWDKGGRLGRNDLALGIGGELNVMVKRHTPRASVFSIFYAFRMTVAKEPHSSKVEMATCGGPCDEPTKPSPWDLGLFFNLGLSWGR
jgi:hypothetical protein